MMERGNIIEVVGKGSLKWSWVKRVCEGIGIDGRWEKDERRGKNWSKR